MVLMILARLHQKQVFRASVRNFTPQNIVEKLLIYALDSCFWRQSPHMVLDIYFIVAQQEMS